MLSEVHLALDGREAGGRASLRRSKRNDHGCREREGNGHERRVAQWEPRGVGAEEIHLNRRREKDQQQGR